MKTPTRSTTTTTAVASSLPLVLAVFFVVSLRTLVGVDGLLASEITGYSNAECEESTTTGSGLRFGVLDVFNASAFHDFNECIALVSANSSVFNVCNVTTGEVGINFFQGTTCTELLSQGAALPSCEQLSSSAECTDAVCAQMLECTDTVASTISPGVVNFIANEYNDINCTDPTGNTEVLSGENIGEISGECFELPGIAHAMGECRADGSYISQFFSPEDDTCSGDVWEQHISVTESSPPVCIAIAVDGLYYGYTSCTVDAATVFFSVPAPTIAPTAALTIAPTPVSIDTAADDTPAPTNDDGGRGISPTAPPSPVPGSGEAEETTSPIGSDEAGISNGAAGTGSGVAVGYAVLSWSCAVGLWVFIAM